MKTALIFGFFMTALSARAGYDMSRYEFIMERSPFGKEPPQDEQTVQAKPAGEFAKQYRLCMLYEDASGQLKAGLVSKTNNKNFFLQVGGNESGLNLVEVRLEEGVAVLEQDGERAQLALEGLNRPVDAAPAAPATVATTSAEPARLIRREGQNVAPSHILVALTDSSPKHPQMTVRKTRSAASADGSSVQGSPVELPAGFDAGASGSSSAPVTVASARPAERTLNYLIQRVPERYNPF